VTSPSPLEHPGPPVIALLGVSKQYRTRTGEVLAVSNLTFQVHERQFVAVLGSSGCGKSTLLKMIAGLIAPTAGEIRVKGLPVTGPLESVGMVFQSPVLLKWRTVLGNVLFPAEALGRGRTAYRDQALALLKLVGLEGFESRYPYELSGGMAQRVSLSRALLLDPDLMLMDEPFGALDALTREEMNLELLRIWEERRKTIVFVTHSISEAVFLADRVVVMTPRPGRVALDLSIDLPRPRSNALRAEARFGELVLRLQQTMGLVR
jgi:NitT/TauT family transport system ATP-binding protein